MHWVVAEKIGGKIRGENFDDYAEVIANARLIAAAPCLLEALQGVVKRCEGQGYVGVDGQYLKVVRAAIAKATASPMGKE